MIFCTSSWERFWRMSEAHSAYIEVSLTFCWHENSSNINGRRQTSSTEEKTQSTRFFHWWISSKIDFCHELRRMMKKINLIAGQIWSQTRAFFFASERWKIWGRILKKGSIGLFFEHENFLIWVWENNWVWFLGLDGSYKTFLREKIGGMRRKWVGLNANTCKVKKKKSWNLEMAAKVLEKKVDGVKNFWSRYLGYFKL